MNFKVDENLPQEVAAELRAAGHDAETVVDEGLSGSPDPLILDRAKREARVLLTMDKGIANVRRYPPTVYAGIVLLRPHTSGRAALITFLRRHVAELLESELSGHLAVVTHGGIRRR